MAIHKETEAKQATRNLILQAAQGLGRLNLSYMGMPAEAALDIKTLRLMLQNVICIANDSATLREAARSIAPLKLERRLFRQSDVWVYLRDNYNTEEFSADITFLDFYGGGIVKADPYATEIAGLRAYFARHALLLNKAFVFAWTFMPHDKGKDVYIAALEKLTISKEELDLVKRTGGVRLRAIALRLILRQIFVEHGHSVKLYNHAVYKKVMNTMIFVFCKGNDPACKIKLESPALILSEPYYTFGERHIVPTPRTLVE